MTLTNCGVKMHRELDRKEQLERLRRRYEGRGKEGRTRLLDEFCEHYGYERKYAIKLLRGVPGPQMVVRRSGSLLEKLTLAQDERAQSFCFETPVMCVFFARCGQNHGRGRKSAPKSGDACLLPLSSSGNSVPGSGWATITRLSSAKVIAGQFVSQAYSAQSGNCSA
jgi:hypothetical protein